MVRGTGARISLAGSACAHGALRLPSRRRSTLTLDVLQLGHASRVCRKIAGVEAITSIMCSAPAKSGFVWRRWSLRSGALAAAPITADSTPSLPWTPCAHTRPVRGLHNAAAVGFGKAADGVTIELCIGFARGTSNFRWSGRRVRWCEARVRALASQARHAHTGRSGCLRAAAQL